MQLFWVLFSGLLPDFWVPFWAIPGFLGIIFWLFPDIGYHFLVKFDFFQNNPDFGVLILIFPSMTLWNVACRALVSVILHISYLLFSLPSKRSTSLALKRGLGAFRIGLRCLHVKQNGTDCTRSILVPLADAEQSCTELLEQSVSDSCRAV